MSWLSLPTHKQHYHATFTGKDKVATGRRSTEIRLTCPRILIFHITCHQFPGADKFGVDVGHTSPPYAFVNIGVPCLFVILFYMNLYLLKLTSDYTNLDIIISEMLFILKCSAMPEKQT
jgi:hypothetical protein